MKGFVKIQNSILEAKEMLSHLEDEYRKANISEKDYKALKEKYSNGDGRVGMSKKDAPKEEDIQEVTPEVIEKLAAQLSEQSTVQEAQQKEEKEKRPGIFSRMFGKNRKASKEEKPKAEAPSKETPAEPQVEDVSASQPQEQPETYPESRPSVSEASKKIDSLEVEIEKLKTILDTLRETGHVTDETIQAISESIGELRSLVFQTDASLKETMVKMEKIEDDISQVKPKEIDKRFREIDGENEKRGIEMEKFQTKLEDSNEKLNRMYEMLKSIGGIENLVEINKKIQEKLKDVEEAVKYIGRIGAKTEKQFMDLSRGLEDLVIFKAKQEDLDESLKDILKSIDSINVKFEGYVSKKDLDDFREEMFTLKKQLDNIEKVLPLINERLPDDIINLRKEREDIQLLMSSLQEQFESKKITKSEYISFKEGNEKRLKEIEKELEREWKKLQKSKKNENEKQPELAVENHVERETPAEIEDVKSKIDGAKEALGEKSKDKKEEKTKEEKSEEEADGGTVKSEVKTEKKKDRKKVSKLEKAEKTKKKRQKVTNNEKIKILNDIKNMKM